SREFIRLDSTYYIGHMYDGAFKFYRASDKIGFQQVIVPLEKAFRLIEKDFDAQLRTRSNDVYVWLRVSQHQSDYCSIVYWLQQSYQNIEMPDKAFEVLSHLRDRNLQFETGVESYNTMAWIYHRNRMYKPEKFSFLKNTVAANDSMAHLYLDSAIMKYRNDLAINVGLMDASYLNQQYLFTYHYKAILFDYELNIDSANFYYDVLLRTGYYSSNNYAEFQYTQGNFRTADDFFHEAESRDGSTEKRTKEYFYMRSHLDIYRASPWDADSLLRRVIARQGSTPGYGWHSIGLARALQYEGLTAESQEKANKAALFGELHIGTTWGPEQYKMGVATLNYTNALRFKREYRFENDVWWFWLNPYNWWKSSNYELRVQENKLYLQTMVANNPERAQVIYPLFTSENLINFDEVLHVIRGFGTDFFIRIYEERLEKDKRPHIKKYFRYFLGRLYLDKGDEEKARFYFHQVLSDPDLMDEYEKLLYARTCEGMALASSDEEEKREWVNELYRIYPQLVPFTKTDIEFHLADTGGVEETKSDSAVFFAWLIGILGVATSAVLYFLGLAGKIRIKFFAMLLPSIIALLTCILLVAWSITHQSSDPASLMLTDLKNCDINFTDNEDAMSVSLGFTNTSGAMEINYLVMDGGKIMQKGILRVPADQYDEGGKLLAYRLFGIKKKQTGYEPAAKRAKEEEGKGKDKSDKTPGA
ncbi:MAG TPA: hypothetical protein VI731_04055, partial [Bacteroidia bacterium]|nr:hypothetical protein [Bacteroidia bacterium]